ncbi:hypothetical protein CCACVL1_24084 [Corchorus capsularis]|uniref:Uncharacterized protein n=1 Tax=Corchorus capsularis TaxID=210143 RepID=A0A1R3GR92_COCAP|nr:hypothetical protein CCACVL1_24084 [Corchorus capsularis]
MEVFFSVLERLTCPIQVHRVRPSIFDQWTLAFFRLAIDVDVVKGL